MTDKKKKLFSILIILGLIFVCAISCVKTLVQEFNVDEQYAIVLGYRMASGESMFLDLWEPHQTSGFVCAFFIKIYMLLFKTTEGLVIYLRILGLLMQVAVSAFVYNVFKKTTSKMVGFYIALTVFALQPKGIQIAEFSNLFIWSMLCTMLCFYSIYMKPDKYKKYAILAGVFVCVSVLCYPSYLIVVPFYAIAMYKLFIKKGHAINVFFLGTCAIIGVGYVSYFLIDMSLEEFLFGIKQMMTDGAHSSSNLEKLLFYLKELKFILLPTIPCVLFSWGLFKILKRKNVLDSKTDKFVFICIITVILTCIYQAFMWMNPNNGVYLHTPLAFYFVAYMLGIKCLKKEKALKWIFYIPTAVAFVAAMLLTNTGIRVTGSYLLPGILAVLAVLNDREAKKEYKCSGGIKLVVLLTFMGLLLFQRTYLVCETHGYKADILYVKQKALSGPALNVYCGWLDGTKYNEAAQVMTKYVKEDDAVLCVTANTLWYLLGECQISNYSTISTPTFDERLYEYWELHPEKYPDVVIIDKDYCKSEYIDVNEFLKIEEVLYSSEFIDVCRVE